MVIRFLHASAIPLVNFAQQLLNFLKLAITTTDTSQFEKWIDFGNASCLSFIQKTFFVGFATSVLQLGWLLLSKTACVSFWMQSKWWSQDSAAMEIVSKMHAMTMCNLIGKKKPNVLTPRLTMSQHKDQHCFWSWHQLHFAKLCGMALGGSPQRDEKWNMACSESETSILNFFFFSKMTIETTAWDLQTLLACWDCCWDIVKVLANNTDHAQSLHAFTFSTHACVGGVGPNSWPSEIIDDPAISTLQITEMLVDLS